MAISAATTCRAYSLGAAALPEALSGIGARQSARLPTGLKFCTLSGDSSFCRRGCCEGYHAVAKRNGDSV